MKTRRTLQVIVGVLSLIVALCLILLAVGVAIVKFFPDWIPTATDVWNTLNSGLTAIAGKIGLADVPIVVICVAYCLPALLLLIAGILLLSRNRGKQAKYTVANILASVGIIILTVFTITCAPTILGGDPGVSYRPEIVDKMLQAVTPLRIACGATLIVFAVFIACAFLVKPKTDDAKQTTVEQQSRKEKVTKTKATTEAAPTENSSEQVEQKQKSTQEGYSKNVEPELEYVPDADMSVHNVIENTYGKSEDQLSADMLAKISKARSLFEMGAITQDEYIKLINVYLGKR